MSSPLALSHMAATASGHRLWRIPWIWLNDLASPSIRRGSWVRSSVSPGDWRLGPRPIPQGILKRKKRPIFIEIYADFADLYRFIYMVQSDAVGIFENVRWYQVLSLLSCSCHFVLLLDRSNKKSRTERRYFSVRKATKNEYFKSSSVWLGEPSSYSDHQCWIQSAKALSKWWFPEMGVPQNGGFIRDTPAKMDDLGVPLF